MLNCPCQKREVKFMTIEIADRLVKLRKKYGYSQEELADKLGLSRQAVSKWERAEASPDTDNLICLAKLYGVSLDELLATDEDIDTIVEEQVKENKEEAPKQDAQEEEKKDKVTIDDDGVVIFSKKGKKVTINDDGVTCYNADGTVKKHHFNTKSAIIGAIEASLFTLAAVAYIVLGATLGWWHIAWIVFFIPDIFCSFLRCLQYKNAQHLNVAFISVFTFFLVCFFLPEVVAGMPALWHPMWVVFLAIPLYHSTVGAFNKIAGKKDEDECKCCSEDKDDDEDEDDD